MPDLWEFLTGFFPGCTVSSDLPLEYYYGSIQMPACGLCIDLYRLAAMSALAQGKQTGKASGCKNPMRLMFDQEKLTVSQEDNSADFTWEQMGRLDAKPSMYILYMDRVHAYLIPKTALGDQEEAFRELVTAHLPKEKRRKI